MSCASYENTLQIYSFLSSSAQDLAEICYKKLQIANFSAGDVRKWWKFSNKMLCLIKKVEASKATFASGDYHEGMWQLKRPNLLRSGAYLRLVH